MLTDSQRANLRHEVRDWIEKLTFSRNELAVPEERFTASFLLPSFRDKIVSPLKPSLLVRGDGGSPMMPVVWSGIAFYPDLAVCEFEHRHIAFEVKILKNKNDGGLDAGGAFTKAIGQTALYAEFGYEYSFGIVFDTRDVNSEANLEHREVRFITPRSEVHVFS